jgi:hypothetical protein
MASITGLTSARMLAIEAASIVSGSISGDNLILTKFDGSTVNAGNVRGATGPTGPDGNPIGTFLMGGWSAEPTNYKFLNGQTLTGGVAAYPTIATLFPSWVSGGNLILPNAMGGAVPLGSTGAGVVSGSMNKTITTAEMPLHAHTGPSHQHALGNHTHTIASHGHTTVNNGQHGHQTVLDLGGYAVSYVVRYPVYGIGTGLFRVWSGGTNPGGSTEIQMGYLSYGGDRELTPGGDHGHTINGSGTLTSDGPSPNLSDAAGTGVTGNAGSGGLFDVTPKNLTVKIAVKVL